MTEKIRYADIEPLNPDQHQLWSQSMAKLKDGTAAEKIAEELDACKASVAAGKWETALEELNDCMLFMTSCALFDAMQRVTAGELLTEQEWEEAIGQVQK